MKKIKPDYIERLYAGWLGKLIGVRLGAPIEGWSYEKIQKVFGEITGYLVDYKDFAADDDTNGPMFLLRTLEDYGIDNTAEQVGLTLLNYAPYEHGFFWWGTYGVSTEHTAYTNLRAGIMAPRSGSVEQNGEAIAEQIGGQIFIDTWGLVAPCDPTLAAQYAEKAASATHGGNGVYGGMFIAACISAAFDGGSIRDVLETGLTVIPQDCEYARVTRDVMAFYDQNSADWRACFAFIKAHYGYDKYPGNCHIIPNAAVMVLSMLYGDGDYGKTINICNMCGWDTDCNVGNVGTILGVLAGLDGIDYDKWRVPINDFYVSSGVLGSMNINDVPSDVFFIARLAYKIAGESPPPEWVAAINGTAPQFNFLLPGSTHGFRIRADQAPHGTFGPWVRNSAEHKALKIVGTQVYEGQKIYVYHKTHYRPADFHDSRYDPCFSPIVYPGQSLDASVMLLEETGFPVTASLYALDENHNNVLEGAAIPLTPGTWQELHFDIPAIQGGLISEIGVVFDPSDCEHDTLAVCLRDFAISGKPDYTIDFGLERNENWRFGHTPVSQFSHLRGNWAIEDGCLCGRGVDFTEIYTGHHNWTDYTFTGTLCPVIGDWHMLNVRVQGGIRSYAAGLTEPNKLGLYKNNNGYMLLCEVDFDWEPGVEYTLSVRAVGNTITVSAKEKELICFTDTNSPYLRGAIGASVPMGRCRFKDFYVKPPYYQADNLVF
ncbi:MAG: ADP-ribosylglycohydrolase family protein [Clostridia bacterium]|nr:ADP-ribosylglycohydrolase family protein [Clostridia bacterium]